MQLQIIQAINKNDAQLCGGWCSWENCNQPKWICIYCGYVECESCSADWFDIIMLENQFGDVYPCRNCRKYNSCDEFPDEWKNRKKLVLAYDKDNDLRIAQSEWENYWKQYPIKDQYTFGVIKFEKYG